MIKETLIEAFDKKAKELFKEQFSGCVLGEVFTSHGRMGVSEEKHVKIYEDITESIVPDNGMLLGLFSINDGDDHKDIDRLDYAFDRILHKFMERIREVVAKEKIHSEQEFFVRRWPCASDIKLKVFNDDSAVSIVVEIKCAARLYLR